MKRKLLVLLAAACLALTMGCACATSGPDEVCEVQR